MGSHAGYKPRDGGVDVGKRTLVGGQGGRRWARGTQTAEPEATAATTTLAMVRAARAVIVAERAAGRGDSPAAIAAIAASGLVDPMAPRSLVRVESWIATGVMEEDARFGYWRQRLVGCSRRIRRGYEAVLAQLGEATFEEVVAGLKRETEMETEMETETETGALPRLELAGPQALPRLQLSGPGGHGHGHGHGHG